MDLLRDNRILLDAFRRGDDAALGEVYQGYAETLFNFMKKGFSFNSKGKHYAFTGFQATWQLEDAVHDVFLRAFRKEARQAYDGLHPFKNYLFTIARNRIIDFFRKEKVEYLDIREIHEVDENEILREEEPLTPEQIAGERELEKLVREFIDGLPSKVRQLFQIRFVEGCSLEEVTKQLRITDYRAKQDEKYIKQQFFNFMQERGYFTRYTFRDRNIKKLVTATLILCGRGI